MKLLTVYSKTHECLFLDHFSPSIPLNFDVVAVNTTQRGSGSYEDEGFRHATLDKLHVILDTIKSSVDPFVYADCDIRFNPNLSVHERVMSLLNTNADIVAQRDWGSVCTGFMIIKPNEKTKHYFKSVIEYMNLPQNSHRIFDFHDQSAFNELYRSSLFLNIERPKINLIDASTGFGNLNHFLPGVIWEPTNSFFKTNHASLVGQCLWHANFTVGVKNKILMLNDYFENVVLRYYKHKSM